MGPEGFDPRAAYVPGRGTTACQENQDFFRAFLVHFRRIRQKRSEPPRLQSSLAASGDAKTVAP
jgi:hypothetical protein